MAFQSGCGRCRTAPACRGWFPNSLASSSSSPKPSGNGQPIPAATARSRYSWTVPSPIPQLRAIWRCPSPNSNLNRRTSLTFRMDFLLAGTLSSFIYGVSMPGDCPASLHLLLLVCGKHSAPSRTPFRQATKTVRLPTGMGVHLQTGMLFGITTESCSASERNRVHLRPDSTLGNGVEFIHTFAAGGWKHTFRECHAEPFCEPAPNIRFDPPFDLMCISHGGL